MNKRSVHRALQRLSLRSSTKAARALKHSGKVVDFHNARRNKSQASELTVLGKAHFFENLAPQTPRQSSYLYHPSRDR